MQTTQLSQWGKFLGTRFLGEKVRVELCTLAEFGPVTLDFTDVSDIECFGVIVSERGLDFLKTQFRFENLSPASRAILRFVISDRTADRHAA
jgi:hypothetical protein